MQETVSRLLERQHRLEEQLYSLEKYLLWSEDEKMAAGFVSEEIRDILSTVVADDGKSPSSQVCLMASNIADQVRCQVEGLYGDGI